MRPAPRTDCRPVPAPDVFLSSSDAAAVPGLSVASLRRLVRAGRVVVDGYVEKRPRFRYSQHERYVIDARPFSDFNVRKSTPGGRADAIQTGVQK